MILNERSKYNFSILPAIYRVPRTHSFYIFSSIPVHPKFFIHRDEVEKISRFNLSEEIFMNFRESEKEVSDRFGIFLPLSFDTIYRSKIKCIESFDLIEIEKALKKLRDDFLMITDSHPDSDRSRIIFLEDEIFMFYGLFIS